jgi:hypothetical protein
LAAAGLVKAPWRLVLAATGFAGTRRRRLGTARTGAFTPRLIDGAAFIGLAARTFARIVITWQSSWSIYSVCCVAGIVERLC